MSLRPRTPADLPACVAALRVVHGADRYPTRWPDDPAGWLDPDGLVAAWVAPDGPRVDGHIGLLAGSAEPGLAAAAGIAAGSLTLVTRLFVTPAARGRGLARSLLAAAVGHTHATGQQLGLDVLEESTDAIALYERLGWRHVGTARASWRTQDGRHPMIRYYLAP